MPTSEIDRALGQLGCRSLAEVGVHLIARHDAGMPATPSVVACDRSRRLARA